MALLMRFFPLYVFSVNGCASKHARLLNDVVHFLPIKGLAKIARGPRSQKKTLSEGKNMEHMPT
jgi:hypothetical protein